MFWAAAVGDVLKNNLQAMVLKRLTDIAINPFALVVLLPVIAVLG